MAVRRRLVIDFRRSRARAGWRLAVAGGRSNCEDIEALSDVLRCSTMPWSLEASTSVTCPSLHAFHVMRLISSATLMVGAEAAAANVDSMGFGLTV